MLLFGGEGKMKKSVPITPFWYSDKIVWPKTVTIITTVNEEGVPNAAPVSGSSQMDVERYRSAPSPGRRSCEP